MSELELTNQPDIRLPKEKKVKIYRALISQTSTNAPTAVILQNTLGTVTFGYDAAGIYTMTTSGLFVADKTFVTLGQSVLLSIATVIDYGDMPNILYIETTTLTGVNQNGNLFKAPLEILVYA